MYIYKEIKILMLNAKLWQHVWLLRAARKVDSPERTNDVRRAPPCAQTRHRSRNPSKLGVFQ